MNKQIPKRGEVWYAEFPFEEDESIVNCQLA